MQQPAFADVKPFPGNPRAVIGGNQPPLEERILVDFDEAIREAGLSTRIDALAAKGEQPDDCTDAERAGQYGDYIKMVTAARAAVEEEREKLNRPLLNAQRALKGRADALHTRLSEASARVKAKLDAFMAAERTRQAEEQRQADEQAAAAFTAAGDVAAEQGGSAAAPAVEIKAVASAAPAFRGDYGARVGSKTIWKHEILSVRQLPDSILKHEKVVEAIDKVIAAQVRGGLRTLKGTRIYSEQTTSVR